MSWPCWMPGAPSTSTVKAFLCAMKPGGQPIVAGPSTSPGTLGATGIGGTAALCIVNMEIPIWVKPAFRMGLMAGMARPILSARRTQRQGFDQCGEGIDLAQQVPGHGHVLRLVGRPDRD